MIHDFATFQRESARSNAERRAVQAPVMTAPQRVAAPVGDTRSPVAWSGSNRKRRLEAAATSHSGSRVRVPMSTGGRANGSQRSSDKRVRTSTPPAEARSALTLTPLLKCWLQAFTNPRMMAAGAVAMVALVVGLFGTFPEDDASQAGMVADTRLNTGQSSVVRGEPVAKPRFVIDTSAAEESQFGFYESLRASPWEVPVQRGVYITEADRKRYSQRYILQAASVRGRSEAESLVRKLKAAGLNASWQSASSNGHGWHRVMVGPFSNVSVMNKAEDILVSLHMMPLKLKVD